MTVESFLTLNDVLHDDDTNPNYECYVDFLGLSVEMELDVVGELLYVMWQQPPFWSTPPWSEVI